MNILDLAAARLIPFVISVVLWCIPLIYLQRAVERPFMLGVYMVLLILGSVVVSAWWVSL